MNIVKSIEHYMQQYMELWPFSGTIHVVKQEEVIFNQAYGRACLEFNVPNTTDTRFALASVSKQFTAFAIMQLYEKGLIDIDQPVNNYLPNRLKLDPRITAHHLLSHTSGLPTFHGLQDDFYGNKDKSNFNPAELLRFFLDCPLHFEPGSSFEYCNAGYHMLAFLIEFVSGVSFKQYLTENIFKPLDLKQTILDEGMEILANKAFGYCMNQESIVQGEYHNLAYSIGAGGIVSNTGDLYKWHLVLKNKLLLSPNTYARFFQVNSNGYSYGLFHNQVHGKRRFYHDGAYLGIGSYVQCFFEDDISIIVLCNYDFANYYRIGDAISDLLFTGNAHVPKKPAEITLDEELALRYEGIYIKDRAELKRVNNSWEFLHLNRFHKPIYPIGNHQFHSTWLDHSYSLKACDDGEFELFGIRKQLDPDKH